MREAFEAVLENDAWVVRCLLGLLADAGSSISCLLVPLRSTIIKYFF